MPITRSERTTVPTDICLDAVPGGGNSNALSDRFTASEVGFTIFLR